MLHWVARVHLCATATLTVILPASATEGDGPSGGVTGTIVTSQAPKRDITVHFGWPMSSWLDRMAIGVMVFNLVRLPRRFPRFKFIMSYQAPWPTAVQKT